MTSPRLPLLAALGALSVLALVHAQVPAQRHHLSCDPRTPVQSVPGNSNWRHVITEPGSYYLTGDVVGAPNMAAIRVDAPGVTIDFNGFALVAGDPGALNAFASFEDDVVLRGVGRIEGWSGGIYLAGARCRVEDMTVAGTGTTGVHMLGPDGTVRRCVITGNEWEGLHLGPDADGATVAECKLRDNVRHQMLVEGDGNRIEDCSLHASSSVTQPALSVTGADNALRRNHVWSGAVGEKAIDVAGDGNSLVENTVRLGSGAVLGEGIAVTGALNEVRGGRVVAEATLARAIRFDQPLNIIAILIGLQAGASDSTGILGNAPGYIEQLNLHVASADSVGIDLQGGTANVGSTLFESRIRVSGAGSTAVRSLASASIVTGNRIVLEAAATGAAGVDVLGSAGGHSLSGNHMILAGLGQAGPILNGAADLVRGEDILVLGDDSTAIRQLSGNAGMISDNRIRLDAANATGIFVSEFIGELVTRNVVIGDGDQYDVGEGNAPSQLLVNPGFGFVAEDVLNVQVGN